MTGEIAVPGNDVHGIAVRIVPEKEIAAYLEAKGPKARADLDDRRRAFQISGQSAGVAMRDDRVARPDTHVADLRVDKTRLAETVASGTASQEDGRAWLRSWETDVFADLPEMGIVVYTDEKGRFTAQVRPGKFAVFASGDFKIGGEPQHRAWGLWMSLTGADKTLILAPHNMLLEQPSDSVLR